MIIVVGTKNFVLINNQVDVRCKVTMLQLKALSTSLTNEVGCKN